MTRTQPYTVDGRTVRFQRPSDPPGPADEANLRALVAGGGLEVNVDGGLSSDWWRLLGRLGAFARRQGVDIAIAGAHRDDLVMAERVGASSALTFKHGVPVELFDTLRSLGTRHGGRVSLDAYNRTRVARWALALLPGLMEPELATICVSLFRRQTDDFVWKISLNIRVTPSEWPGVGRQANMMLHALSDAGIAQDVVVPGAR